MLTHSRLALTILLVFCAVFSFRSAPAYAGGGYGIVFPTSNLFDGDVVREIRIRELKLEVLQAEVDAAQAELDIRLKEQYQLELIWAFSKEFVPKAMPTPQAQLTTSTMMRLLELAILD